MIIFPHIPQNQWELVNLNEMSKEVEIDFRDPVQCQRFIKERRELTGKYSYGGFKEDRSHIFRHHYHAQSQVFIHLGIDYNVPEGTEVCMPASGEIIHIMNDSDQNGGWGRRIIWKLNDTGLYLIMGHLSKNGLELKPEMSQRRGDLVGKIGGIEENGGWFPHLHVQLINKRFIQHYEGRLNEIDGYLKEEDPLLKEVLNPDPLVRLSL